MNKNNSRRKFGRKRDQREALLEGLANALVLHEKILTTAPRAKELRKYIEPIITKSKLDTVKNRRLVARKINSAAVKKLFSSIAPRYKEIFGGYTRIVKHSPRKTDSSPLAVIELR